MPSPGTDGGAQESVPAPQKQTGIKLGCGLLLIFAILAGIVLWLAKPPAGPPIVASPPVGRLYFLMVNAASEHTAALRGLYTLGEGDKKPKLLMEEKESQGMEDAPREWISFPKVSPDGKYLAYLDATYFITEESQTSQEQLMIAALSSSGTPKLLFNIPLLSRTSPVGITWDPRTGNIFFISPPDLCKVDGATGKLTKTPLGAPPGASYPTKANYGILFFIQGGSLFGLPSGKGKAPTLVTRTSTYAFSPTNTLAFIQADNPHKVNVSGRTYTLQWAEPWFYHGHVTSLGFSPDGAYLGYTVTNPIVPEEGFYYLRLSDGKCFRLPFSTSRAGWDWAR